MEGSADPVDNGHRNDGECKARHPKEDESSALQVNDPANEQRNAKHEPHQHGGKDLRIENELQGARIRVHMLDKHSAQSNGYGQEYEAKGRRTQAISFEALEARNVLEYRTELVAANGSKE